MSLTGYLLLAVYVFGWLAALYPINRVLFSDDADDDDRGLAIVGWYCSALFAALWPAALVVWLSVSVSRRMWGERDNERVKQ